MPKHTRLSWFGGPSGLRRDKSKGSVLGNGLDCTFGDYAVMGIEHAGDSLTIENRKVADVIGSRDLHPA